MIYFLMYLLTIIENLAAPFVIMAAVGMLGWLIMTIMTAVDYASYGEESDMEKPKLANLRKKLGVVGIVGLMGASLLPSQKGLAFVFIAPQIIENGAVKETVKNIPELTQLGTEYLKEILKEKVNAKN